MKFLCAPRGFNTDGLPASQRVVLFDTGKKGREVHAGASIAQIVKRRGMTVDPISWDFLAIALSAYAADSTELRAGAPDGWTRNFELTIAVQHPEVWNAVAGEVSKALEFLSTDRWSFKFIAGGMAPPSPRKPREIELDAAVLLSGGLDSLVGALDLAKSGKALLAVSKLVRGDAERQVRYANRTCKEHVAFNDSTRTLRRAESSQRTRSLVFIAFGVLSATSLARYRRGQGASLFLCENGFIAINPPLTGSRLGSLSTRTAHPVFLNGLSRVLARSGISVEIINPYRHQTKGEMLVNCLDQPALIELAASSTSCGRFQKFKYRHCGRCIPCQVRRASILAWGGTADSTDYVYKDLSIPNSNHAGFDDVRAVGIAIQDASVDLGTWVGNALGAPNLPDRTQLREMLQRGITELSRLHVSLGI